MLDKYGLQNVSADVDVFVTPLFIHSFVERRLLHVSLKMHFFVYISPVYFLDQS